MGWYSHPDTMCIDKAQGELIRKHGEEFVRENDFESLAYQKAFRDSYAEHCNYKDLSGFKEYIDSLDEHIRFLEEGKTPKEIEEILRARFLARIGNRSVKK